MTEDADVGNPGAGIDGSGTQLARCVLAPNPSPMTLDGTNTWIIAAAASSTALVVDPGPDDPGHLRRVYDQAAVSGRRLSKILLTHSHLDHADGAAGLAAMTGAPVLAADPAHRRGEEGLAPGGAVSGGGCDVRVVASPGHTPDSVCLLLPADGALLTGDTVLGRGTTVIASDGSLADYLDSLDRLRALAEEVALTALLPGHGPMLTDPVGVLDSYIAHRRDRIAQITAALTAGDRTVSDIVARVYADVDRSLWPAAEWSVRAQLDYLAAKGRLPSGVQFLPGGVAPAAPANGRAWRGGPCPR